MADKSTLPGTWRFADPFPTIDLRPCTRYVATVVGLTVVTQPTGGLELRDGDDIVWTLNQAMAAGKLTNFIQQEKRVKVLNQ